MTVVSPETKRRLRWHAGLEEIAEASIPSISACTVDTEVPELQLERAVADFIAALGMFNHELNGEVPSESQSSASDIPRDIAYAVAEVVRMLDDFVDADRISQGRSTGSREAWLVKTAWLAVLAGDIDDLQRHLDEEEAMRAGQ